MQSYAHTLTPTLSRPAGEGVFLGPRAQRGSLTEQ